MENENQKNKSFKKMTFDETGKSLPVEVRDFLDVISSAIVDECFLHLKASAQKNKLTKNGKN